MTDYTSLYKLVETLYSNYNGKSMLPDWFSVNLKTLLSKNITIEDWNSLQLNVKNVVGESSALYSFCNSLTPVIKELINSTAHSVKFNGNVLYLLDANGEIIASGVLQISYDMELSADSTNAVQNKVIKEALDKKLDKVTDPNSYIRVYGISPAGSQKAIPTSESPNPGYVAMYGTEGQLSSEDPTETYHVANKNYVDKAIENIDLKSDVVDIVHTHADLESYDTSTLTADDIIKVLQDETHDNASSYYRWNTVFEYVGSEGPYYTQSQVDEKLDNKVDKVEKTDKWQLYGVGDKNVDLPNNGKTINAESKAVAHTVINRNEYGRAEINDPVDDLDITNKKYVDSTFKSITTKIVQNNGIAKYIEKNINYNINGAYARAFTHNKNIYILANNTFYLYSKDTSELTVLKSNLISETLDPNTTERVNEQPVEIPNTNNFLCAYRVKKSNGYEIRLRQFDYDGNNIGNYFTVATSTSFGLYEPFIIMVSATTGYIYYSKENNSVNQDIAMKKFTITNNTISVGGENIVVSGTNQKSDNGKVVANSRPGFSVITRLLDGTYLMLIESNVNVNQTDNPYVIQYVYIKDLNDPTTYTIPKTLLKSNKQIINIPYITTTSDGRIAISYHSTENYYEEPGDGIGIHKKTFNAIISKNKIKYGQELNAYDFEVIPTLATTKNQWSGGWGSIIFINQIYLLYVYGSNTATTSTQTNFSISTIETVDNILTKHDASVEVKNNSIMKRSSKGFSYTATPVNLDPTQQPTLTVNKAYVANYVSKITTDLNNSITETLKNYTPLSTYNESLTNIANNTTDITNIKKVIPNQANENNKLADKNFVNSTINSNAAFFIGNFATYADLETWQNENPSKATNNDYAYVNSDEKHNGEAWRYQYVKKDNEVVGIWKAQFKINDTPLTAEQLAAINSGVTKETIDNLSAEMPTDINTDKNYNLILEHDGTEITGQKKKVVLPPFSYSSNTFKLINLGLLISEDKTMTNYTEIDYNGIRNYKGSNWISIRNGYLGIGYGPYNYNMSVDNSTQTIRFHNNFSSTDIYLPNKSGTVALTSDIDSKLDVIRYDYTKLVFDDNGYQAPLPSDLKTLIKPYFDNNKSFIINFINDDYTYQYYLKGIDAPNGLMLVYFVQDTLNEIETLHINMKENIITHGSASYAYESSIVRYNPDVAKAVYTNNENNQQSMVAYSLLPGDSNIAQFDTNGHLYTNDPSIDSHCANKKYVDSTVDKGGLKTFVLKQTYDFYSIDSGLKDIVNDNTDIDILYECVNYVKNNRCCILEFVPNSKDETYGSNIRFLLTSTSGNYGTTIASGVCDDYTCSIVTTGNHVENENYITIVPTPNMLSIRKIYVHQYKLGNAEHQFYLQTYCPISSYSKEIIDLGKILVGTVNDVIYRYPCIYSGTGMTNSYLYRNTSLNKWFIRYESNSEEHEIEVTTISEHVCIERRD